MSILIMSQVWKDSKAKGSTLLLQLAIADHADDDGVAYPGTSTLAKKIRMSERQVTRLRNKLYEMGEIEYVAGGRFKGDKLSVRVTPGAFKGDISGQKNPQMSVKGDISGQKNPQMSPEPSEPSVEPSEPSIEPDPVTDEDFAAKVLAESYANPVPGYVIGNGRNPEIAIDNYYDSHAAVVAKYGQEAYRAAVSACVASQYHDGRKAEHVENQAQLLKAQPATATNDNGEKKIPGRWELIDGKHTFIPEAQQ